MLCLPPAGGKKNGMSCEHGKVWIKLVDSWPPKLIERLISSSFPTLLVAHQAVAWWWWWLPWCSIKWCEISQPRTNVYITILFEFVQSGRHFEEKRKLKCNFLPFPLSSIDSFQRIKQQLGFKCVCSRRVDSPPPQKLSLFLFSKFLSLRQKAFLARVGDLFITQWLSQRPIMTWPRSNPP